MYKTTNILVSVLINCIVGLRYWINDKHVCVLTSEEEELMVITDKASTNKWNGSCRGQYQWSLEMVPQRKDCSRHRWNPWDWVSFIHSFILLLLLFCFVLFLFFSWKDSILILPHLNCGYKVSIFGYKNLKIWAFWYEPLNETVFCSLIQACHSGGVMWVWCHRPHLFQKPSRAQQVLGWMAG